MGVSALELRRRVLMAQPHKERKTGGIVSFNTHVPQVLGVSVPLSPVQAGTGDPYPPGGGKNKYPIAIGEDVFTNNGGALHSSDNGSLIINTVSTSSASGVYANAQSSFRSIFESLEVPFTVSVEISATVSGNVRLVVCGSQKVFEVGTEKQRISVTATSKSTINFNIYGVNNGATLTVSNLQIEEGSTATDFAPYSNIRPISGHTGATACRTGKNLLPQTNYKESRFSVAEDGTISQLDEASASWAWTYTNSIFRTTLPPGTYSVTETLLDNVSSASHSVKVIAEDNTIIRSIVSGAKPAGEYSQSFTIDKTTNVGIAIKCYSAKAKLSMVAGATASEYVPYSGESFPFTFPATWKNLIDDSQKVKSGSSIFIGTETANTPGITLPPGTYTVAFVITANLQRNMYAKDADTGEGIPGFPSYQAYSTSPAVVTFTLTKQTRMILWTYNTSYTSASDVISVMLNEGSTALPYEPYTNTVYGGRLEPAAGVLTVTHAMWTKNTADMDSTAENYPGWTLCGIKGIVGSGLNATLTVFSNIGTRVGVNTRNTADTLFLSKAIYGKTKEEWVSLAIEVQVVAELAEPLIVPLTPAEIRALMGENNVFADTGDVDVEFWTN